jgi:hypothetical protein
MDGHLNEDDEVALPESCNVSSALSLGAMPRIATCEFSFFRGEGKDVSKDRSPVAIRYDSAGTTGEPMTTGERMMVEKAGTTGRRITTE